MPEVIVISRMEQSQRSKRSARLRLIRECVSPKNTRTQDVGVTYCLSNTVSSDICTPFAFVITKFIVSVRPSLETAR
jgi:hypothetical protein